MSTKVEKLLSDFCNEYKVLSYRKGDLVIRGDDEPTGVYLIKNGIVKMSALDDTGGELSVNIYKEGTFFPMTWAISDIPNNYNYETLSDTKLVRIPKDKFVEFLKNNPEVLFDLTRRVIIGLDGLVFNMRYLLSGRSEAKVAVILYSLARRFGVNKGEKVGLEIDVTHHDISRFAGLTRETTTIALNKLIRKGVVLQSKRKLYIKDIKELANVFQK